MAPGGFELALPGWVPAFLAARSAARRTGEERMQLAVELAAENVRQRTGGPFGAAVFHGGSGELVSVGVNAVIANRCSLAHAEIMALALAQQVLGTHDLAQRGGPGLELATSAEPCGMCLGALLWSGVASVLCAAAREDVEACGFDEGLRSDDWVQQAGARGVSVALHVLRADARRVLETYARGGGPIYNAGHTVEAARPPRPRAQS